jgi:hypothetical protein
MEDFTRNITLRALSVSDFVKIPQEKEDKDFYGEKYTLSDKFEFEGDLKAGVVAGTFWLEYRLYDCEIYGWESDTFEELIKNFNDWRMKIYSDLLLLPDNKTITIKMTGYDF